MRLVRFSQIAALLLLTTLFTMTALGGSAPQPKVDYARDIEPFLKAHCFQCHSGDQKQGGLLLDSREAMLRGGVSGAAVTPGKPAASLLITRVTGQDGKPKMPLGFAPIPDTQIRTLRAWIEQGALASSAAAKPHWAYVRPVRAKLPPVKALAWCRDPIDRFVLARIEQAGLKPSPEADRTTLIRRLSIDLTGLPPTPKEVDAYLADRSPDAYARVVDRLLASPHYGERMALPWLDAARYADSNGFQQDGDTYQYVWRDWVVKAMNANMPFDRFTIEQLAGDLLPNPTLDQRIATGFNRCHLLNGEGGAIPEEQRNVILFDRVDVTSTTWLAATMACAQCHNHKYDPYTQKDYYSLMAFFNNVPETGTPPFGGQYRIAEPFVLAETDEDREKIRQYEARIAAAGSEAERIAQSSEVRKSFEMWQQTAFAGAATAPELSGWRFAGPFPADSFDAAFDKDFVNEKSVDPAANYLNGKVKWIAKPEWTDGSVYQLDGENAAFYLYRTIRSASASNVTFSFGSDDGMRAWLNGKEIVSTRAQRAAAPDQERATVALAPGENRLLVKIVNGGGIGGFYFKLAEAGIPANIVAARNKPDSARSEAERKQLFDYFVAAQAPPALREARGRVAAVQKDLEAYRTMMPKVMVMSDDRPRKTHVLLRGNYESPADEVSSATPSCLPPMPSDAPRNRLGLAKWLVSADNPLTARVQVNRWWQHFFGRGLVKTSENMGTQCEPPTHPELLDWLAVEFRESGWDVKRLHRRMVMSAAYRQSARVTPELLRNDPENKLYARAARFRMPSLILRDVALASSGLLNAKLGGKPVYPYQPKGIWDGLAITNERDFSYPQSKGDDLYRRSLYTFWRRTVAPANMFDASTRTTCKVRTSTTSTPLHALTTLNDVTWIEAARALAQRVMKGADADPNARLATAFRLVCARRPSIEEARILRRDLDRALAFYKTNRGEAEALLKQGDSPRDMTLDTAQHAAYASVCLAIYNLDEALTRE